MVIKIALLLSIVLQFAAAILAIRFIKITRGKISWILISAALVIIAIRRLIEIAPYIKLGIYKELYIINDWLGILTSLMITVGVIFIGEIFFSFKKSEIERERTERKILTAVLDAENNERKRFARDLHDGLAPILTTIKLYTDLLKKGSNKKISDEKAIQNIDELVDLAISTTKEVSDNIMSNTLSDFGLIAAIKEFCNYINDTNSIIIGIDGDKYKNPNPGMEETLLFQITKELINNTLKHAEAEDIFITFRSDRDKVSLEYTDNGKGFDTEKILKETTGTGLSNIINKINSIKGTVVINSQLQQGTDILISVDK